MEFWRKVLLIILVILTFGAAFNDGFSGWLLSILFLGLLYHLLPYKRVYKLIFIPVIFALIFFISSYKTQSSIVYPVIGQKVVVLEDLPLWGLDNHRLYHQYYFDDLKSRTLQRENRNIEIKDIDHIKAGSIFNVNRVEIHNADLGVQYYYIFSNDTEEFSVSEHELDGDGEIIEVRHDAFCTKVEWEFCNKVNLNDDVRYPQPDPMRKIFRLLASLP